MNLTNEQYKEILVTSDFFSKEEFEKLEQEAKIDEVTLRTAILNTHKLSEPQLNILVADYFNLPYINLSQIPISEEGMHLIPEEMAREQRVIIFRNAEDMIHMAVEDPDNIQPKIMIGKKTGKPIKLYLANEKDISYALGLYSENIKNNLTELVEESEKKLEKENNPDIPIIEIVDTLLLLAYKKNSSDVHIEPMGDRATIRYRIDGILYDITTILHKIHRQILTRIKILAGLKTDEHKRAQDGRMTIETENSSIDLRVSVIPITEGEQIVLRLLSEKMNVLQLQDLGLNEENIEKLHDAYSRPNGMILSTGPTGSGKTTTMYAILSTLNQRKVNIMTIEDPVEYDIDGINQIQVDRDNNLTFANGLRSILRQDPDIILVGEIRDNETANIAINGAMTGHLVLSTIHTNDSATTVPRLIDMEIEPFLISTSVQLIIAQRLVRKICPVCKTSKKVKLKSLGITHEKIKHLTNSKDEIRVYYGKGCDVCEGKGFRGRIGIFEVMYVDDDIKKAINEKKDAATIMNIAIKNGMKTLIQDGMQKVLQGVTTIEEVLRASRE